MKAVLIICLLISFPGFVIAKDKTNWDAYLKKENIDTKIFYKQIDQKKLDEPITSWQIIRVINTELKENNKKSLIVAFTARSEEGAPVFGGFAFFKKANKSWSLKQFETFYEYMVSIEVADLIEGGNKELVVNYGQGNRGSSMSIYKYDKDKWKENFKLDGYNVGPLIIHDHGKDTIVDFRNSFLYACEGCQICYELLYEWNGKTFAPVENQFDKCVAEYNKNYDEKTYKNIHLEKSLKLFEEYLKTHPNSFAAAYNCTRLSGEMGLKDKEKKYKVLALKIGMQNPECPHWNLPNLDWQKDNLQGRIDYLNESN